MRCRIAGCAVRFRASASLEELLREAFGHLRSEDRAAPPGLRFDVWDEAATGVSCPERASRIDAAARHPFALSPDDRFVGHRWPGTLSWLDRRRRHVVACVADARRLALHERARPFEIPLLFGLRDLGVQLVHAALASRHGDGVLFVGASGSGKSTAAVQCALAGYALLGDDKVALTIDDEGVTGHSIGSGVLLEPAQLARLPGLPRDACRDARPGDPKSLVVTSRAFGGRLAASARIRAIALPHFSPGPPESPRPAAPRDALVAAALSTALSLPIDADRSMERLGLVAARVPAYHLRLGPSAQRIGADVDWLLSQAGRR